MSIDYGSFIGGAFSAIVLLFIGAGAYHVLREVWKSESK